MKKIYIMVEWVCDQCGHRKEIILHHEPDEFKNEYPFSLPKGWFYPVASSKHYCSEKCLCVEHPEAKDSVWMA